MLGSELRQKYIDFFVSKGSRHLPSDSLVPNDPTLLFTSAGMVQFKPYFLGERTPPASRAVTCQKCLRTTDIEEVGDTSHCTFFEMLGNFSYGDYFKAEAISYAWEFLFDVLKLDLARVRVSVFEDDDEAYELWVTTGMPANKIFRFGEKDNYWPAGAITLGPNGPCGPCSEIFYDTQPHLPPTPDGVWDDARWLEIWNLVFMQFERHDGGNLTPLPKRNIDTGMGFERTTAVLNDLRGPFETDLFAPILARLEEISGKKYTGSDDAPQDIAFRRIADHVRATAFCLADGVLPSNVGRGYVLRRIMRRAILAGSHSLGLSMPVLTEAIPTVIAHYQATYPELLESQDLVMRYAAIEESQFSRTLLEGTGRLNTILESIKAGEVVSGADAFTLFGTYGFPIEMTIELARERGVGVDTAAFQGLLATHQEVSHGSREREVMLGNTLLPKLRELHVAPTHFTGYDEAQSEAKVAALVKAGELVQEVIDGDSVQVVLDRTPFYAEAGGQVGDVGWLRSAGGEVQVTQTLKDSAYSFHVGEVRAGSIRVGEFVDAQIDADRRQAIRRNHSTTHLLHKALQLVLGSHVAQRGSLVAPDKLRFDFSHEKGLTPDETRQVEAYVNEMILADLEVETMEKSLDEAKKMGAMMLFGEKYGHTVRVVRIGDFSLEFCGGTHLAHTSQAGLFKILSEGSSQAGVRRIEAVTGRQALLKTLDQERILMETAHALKTTPTHLVSSVERLQGELKARERELTQLQKATSGDQVERLVDGARQVKGFKMVAQALDADPETLRTLADEILDRLKSGVVILGSASGAKVSLAVKVSRDLVESKSHHAGDIVKMAAKIAGGGGGGRADFAQAGGKDPAKLGEALAAAEKMVTG